MNSDCRPVKIVVVGDGMVGKTCLLITYAKDEYPVEYVPTVFENYSGAVQIGDRQIPFELWDTAGQEEYSHLRPLTYPNTDVIILCFSLVGHTSFQNVESKWLKEIQNSEHLRTKPIILVGTKLDLREDTARLGVAPVVTFERGKRMARRIGAEIYLECSAATKSFVKEVFDKAIRCALARKERKTDKCKCIIL